MYWAKPRAKRSALPPASNGTRMVRGRRGQVCVCVCARAGEMRAAASAAVPARKCRRLISRFPLSRFGDQTGTRQPEIRQYKRCDEQDHEPEGDRAGEHELDLATAHLIGAQQRAFGKAAE